MVKKPLNRGSKFIIAVAISIATLVVQAGEGRGSSDRSGPSSRSQRNGGPGISLDNAVSNIRRKNPGRVLSADSVKRRDRQMHRIKILTPSGRVKNLYMDSKTGQILER